MHLFTMQAEGGAGAALIAALTHLGHTMNMFSCSTLSSGNENNMCRSGFDTTQ